MKQVLLMSVAGFVFVQFLLVMAMVAISKKATPRFEAQAPGPSHGMQKELDLAA
jgi:hypothetical protein